MSGFEDLGAYVISADKVSHSFLVPYTSVGQRIIDLLGPEIIIENTLSRKAIAEKFLVTGIYCCL